MNPQSVFCPNSACHARGHIGKGNIRVHSHTERRYVCDECNSTFAATKGTVFYRRRLSKDIIVKIITLLAHGCPRQAIVAAFEVDERTVKSFGNNCQQVHEHLVEQPCDLGQVQGDEIYAKVQGCILWLAMAIQIQTRLWLGRFTTSVPIIRTYEFQSTCLVVGDAGYAEHLLLQMASPITYGLSKNCYRFGCLHRVGSLQNGEGVPPIL